MKSIKRNTLVSSSRGFTIVELLIVVVVIAILSAIIIVSYNGITRQAKNSAITVGLSNSIKLLRMYRDEHGTWPTESQSARYSYCLGRDFPLYSGSGANPSASLVSPQRGCGDFNGSMRLESAWLYDTLKSYGNLPGAVAAVQTAGGTLSSAPIYTTVPLTTPPDLQGMTAHPGFTYPSKAPLSMTNNPGTRYYITYAMVGTGHNCSGIQHAQAISEYAGTSRCVVLLEFYE